MAIFKFLFICVSSVVVIGGLGIYLLYRLEQNELNSEVEWEQFDSKWKSNRDASEKMKLLEKELEEMCKGNDCSTKQGILDATKSKFNVDSIFNNRLSGISDIGSSISEICQSIIKDFKYIKAFCPE